MLKLFLPAAAAVTAALALGGCAVSTLEPGSSREAVTARYGTPSRVVPLATGSRLQYSRQPAGHSAFMVDLDASGRVTAAREVLNPAHFVRVVPGQWTREDTEREFGRPASIDRVASWPGDILTYRWLDADQPMYFSVYLDARNRVQQTGQGMEFPSFKDDR